MKSPGDARSSALSEQQQRMRRARVAACVDAGPRPRMVRQAGRPRDRLRRLRAGVGSDEMRRHRSAASPALEQRGAIASRHDLSDSPRRAPSAPRARNRSRLAVCAIMVDEIVLQRGVGRAVRRRHRHRFQRAARPRRDRTPASCALPGRAILRSAATTSASSVRFARSSAAMSAPVPRALLSRRYRACAQSSGRFERRGRPARIRPVRERTAWSTRAPPQSTRARSAPSRQSRAASTAMVRLSSSQLQQLRVPRAAAPRPRRPCGRCRDRRALESQPRQIGAACGGCHAGVSCPLSSRRYGSSSGGTRSSRESRSRRARCGGRVPRASGRCAVPGN